jgi:hypothetical protein
LGGRKSRLLQFAQQKGKPATDLNVQLDYIVWELKGGNSYETAQFKKAMAYGPDVASKTRGFAYEVERASKAELEGSMSKRIGAAKAVYGSSVTLSSQQRQQQADREAQQAATQIQISTQSAATSPAVSGSTVTPAQSAATPSAPAATPSQAQVAPTQAPPAVSASVPQIMQQAEYEIPGGAQSTIVPIPMGGSSAPMMMGGGTRTVPVGISKQALLNSYYQAQLIGFLYKQG